MFGRSEAEKEEEARGGNIRDVEAYFKQVQSVIKRYRRVVEKLELIKKDKKKTLERMELITERGKLKDEFIAKKQAARANIKMLKAGLDVLKEKELKELQEEYREVDADFKALGVVVEKDALMEGGSRRVSNVARALPPPLFERGPGATAASRPLTRLSPARARARARARAGRSPTATASTRRARRTTSCLTRPAASSRTTLPSSRRALRRSRPRRSRASTRRRSSSRTARR